jgi:hypothetical protein
MKPQQVYTEIMECRTRKELNHVITKHEDVIISHKWLHEILKDALKRLTVVQDMKRIYS